MSVADGQDPSVSTPTSGDSNHRFEALKRFTYHWLHVPRTITLHQSSLEHRSAGDYLQVIRLALYMYT